ncbi:MULTISPECIES: hypothetical protein [Actinomadura]|uniref:Uncharacterized protein n=1 Tax=Actinomadura yumaensis TaxID=111807 RepID=A0ABW2CVK7_9ACTN|nr:hypothetical protein [Actinomadura sp. J1-007]MWK37618.1 hypothetical protein [Actinomadura sp. J1-007]
MGTPNYPDDWADQWNQMRTGIQAAMTAARARVKFAKIAAAELIVGTLTGRRIVINPEGGAEPSIRFYPEGIPENYAEIWGRADPDSPGYTRLVLSTTQTAANTQVRLDKDQFRAMTFDAEGVADGGTLDVRRDAVDVGFVYTDVQSRFRFLNDGLTLHYGRWWNYADGGPQQGIFTGQVRSGDGSGGAWTDLAIGYGATRASATVPVVTVYNTANDAPFAWKLQAASTAAFTVRVEGSHAFYANFWCFRV